MFHMPRFALLLFTSVLALSALTTDVHSSEMWILYDFTAHETDLEREHQVELDEAAGEIDARFGGKRALRCVRLIGHAATWRGISQDEYCRRSVERAKSAADHLAKRLAALGRTAKIVREEDVGLGDTKTCIGKAEDEAVCKPIKGVDVTLVVGGRADKDGLKDNLTDRTDREARHNRAINRRVELTSVPAKKPGKKSSACKDRDLARMMLDMDLGHKALKARKEERFQTRVHRRGVTCVRSKLTGELVDGDGVDEDILRGWKGLRSATRPKPLWNNYTESLRKTCRRRGNITSNDFIRLYNSMVKPIEDIIPEIQKVLNDLTPNPFGGESLLETKSKIPECRAVKPIYLRSAKSDTIYHCICGWTRPALEACFK